MNVTLSLTVVLDVDEQSEQVGEVADSFARQVVGFGLAGLEATLSCEPDVDGGGNVRVLAPDEATDD